MAQQPLAVKHRPQTFEDVTEQESIKIILQQQLATNTIKNTYLFAGGAGTGKTTCARILADAINKGQGNPIELDAASNNSVDDMRELIAQAKTKSLDSEYKVFIIDECHMITNAGWNAILKLIEEPPAKSIFIFATTDPQKIPKTILSRVQRYDFHMISQQGIIDRLNHILMVEENCLMEEGAPDGVYRDNLETGALEYIAKLADGHMRDAITSLDKCLAYSTDLTLENVVKALGATDYDTMFKLTESLLNSDNKNMIEIIEGIHTGGKDLKLFIKQYMQFLLDLNKFGIGCDWKYISIPRLKEYEEWLNDTSDDEFGLLNELLTKVIRLNTDIKYSSTPKYEIEAVLLME